MVVNSLKGLRGFLIDAPERGRIRGIRDGAVVIEDGRVALAGPFEEVRRVPEVAGVRWLHSPESVIIPGLIDLRAQLSQYPEVAGLESARRSAREREFNAGTARVESPLFFEALARHGTTTAMLDASIYEESCDAAFAAAEAGGLRIIMGMMMDGGDGGGMAAGRPSALPLEQSERLCRKWHGRDGGRLGYAFTLKGAGASSAAMMAEVGLIARKFDAYVQTVVAEDAAEIAMVRQRFPADAHPTGVYERCGLLGDRTVLGHGVHLSDGELATLAETRSVVAHCPTADFFRAGGIMPLARTLDAGVRVGLGSDVGGGPELNLWQVMRSSIEGQKARSFFEAGTRVPTEAELFYLATLGGADALGKADFLGTIDIGKEADLVVLDLAQALPYGRRGNLHANRSAEEIVMMMVYRGTAAAVVETFVRGRSVYRAPAPLLL